MRKYLFNNSRKMHGIPMYRKFNSKKRFYSRNINEEAINGLIEYWDGKYEK